MLARLPLYEFPSFRTLLPSSFLKFWALRSIGGEVVRRSPLVVAVLEGLPVFTMNRNGRVPTKSNHGARPCSSVGRKSRHPLNRTKPIWKTYPFGLKHREHKNLWKMGKTHWKKVKKYRPQEVLEKHVYIAKRLQELSIVPQASPAPPRIHPRLEARQVQRVPSRKAVDRDPRIHEFFGLPKPKKVMKRVAVNWRKRQ